MALGIPLDLSVLARAQLDPFQCVVRQDRKVLVEAAYDLLTAVQGVSTGFAVRPLLHVPHPSDDQSAESAAVRNTVPIWKDPDVPLCTRLIIHPWGPWLMGAVTAVICWWELG